MSVTQGSGRGADRRGADLLTFRLVRRKVVVLPRSSCGITCGDTSSCGDIHNTMPTAPSQPAVTRQEEKQETTEQPVTVVAGPGEVHYDEMKTHSKDNDCWMAIHGKVSILRILSNLPALQVR